MDIKAAFDSLNRGKLWEIMERRGLSKTLRERIRKIYVETENRVRVGMECGDSFWTARGVRQGCPLSAKLFILYMVDLEEVLRRRGKRGVEAVLGGARLYSLQYADDVVLLVREESGMRLMIGEMKKYLEEKELEVNVGKTKIIRFGIGKGEKERWMWEVREIEKVDEFKYLGYIFRKNGGQEGQIRDRVRKTGEVLRSVWGIGKRIFRGNYMRRMWCFDAMVWTMLGYGVVVWGWEERRAIEGMQERYMRWVMGLDWVMPAYMVRNEGKREKLRIKATKRAWQFEEKLREGGGNFWRKCLKEIEKGGKKEGGTVEVENWKGKLYERKRS